MYVPPPSNFKKAIEQRSPGEDSTSPKRKLTNTPRGEVIVDGHVISVVTAESPRGRKEEGESEIEVQTNANGRSRTREYISNNRWLGWINVAAIIIVIAGLFILGVGIWGVLAHHGAVPCVNLLMEKALFSSLIAVGAVLLFIVAGGVPCAVLARPKAFEHGLFREGC